MSDNSEAFEDRKSEMLEDEEMPTFISVSSKDISLPYTADTAEANIQQLLPLDNSANPLRGSDEPPDDYEAQSRSHTTEEQADEGNDDNEEGSVCIVSSGEEADDVDRFSRSYDEDVDEEEEEEEEEDEDDDDDDDEDDDDEEDIHDMGVIPAEDEVVEVADDMLGDFSEEEIEREDVMSDDMALRSDKPKVINRQQRSQSLQDLSEYRTLPRFKSSITSVNKYSRVQSKVKRYIQDLKDMNKRSAERRLSMEESRRHSDFSAQACQDEAVNEYDRNTRGRKSIKGYAEQVLKDLEVREQLTKEEGLALTNEDESNCAVRENQNDSPVKVVAKNVNREHPQKDIIMNEMSVANDIVKVKKPNMNGELLSDHLKNIRIPKQITVNYVFNGQTQGQNIMDVRSIGYDEYMRGSSNSSTDKNLVHVESNEKPPCNEMTEHKKMQITNVHSEAPTTGMAIKNVQSVKETPMEVVEHQEDIETVASVKTDEKNNAETLAQLALVQTQLNQKTTQCKEIREAYEKTLSENFELKQELEELKKTLSKLSANQKPTLQLVAVAIQTDPPPNCEKIETIPSANACTNPKLSTSSMGSAISYNTQWTESAGSLPASNGSIRPLPNLTPLSNAEDSFIGVSETPPRPPHQPSHAFQTSSKIIRMLSNITRRKSKTDDNVTGNSNMANIFGTGCSTSGVSSFSTPINNRGSNKRKATEMPDNTNFLQPPKIPHTAGGYNRLHRRTKSEFKYPGDYVKINSQPFVPQSNDANRPLENLEYPPKENDAVEDPDSGVKCFTYREDENSLETSFLIQAEDETKSQDGKDGERAAPVVRECGPYLLGNVEVRMTEINGTINIWGKEVSQETNTEDELEEVADKIDEANERGSCGCWQKTPNTRNSTVDPLSCSTNKKLKIPPLRLSESGHLKNFSSLLPTVAKESTSAIDNFRECPNSKHSMNLETNGNCWNCEAHSNTRNVNQLKRSSNFAEEENTRNFAKNYLSCNCEHEHCDYSPRHRVSRHCHGDHDCASTMSNLRETGRCSRLQNTKDNEQSKTEVNLSRNHLTRFTSNFADENVTCSHGVRKNSIMEDDDDDVFKKPSTSNARVIENCCRSVGCRSRSPSFSNLSTEPLLSHHPHEHSEVRRRRSSGKRVRGILMDFLRGCGDCHATNSSDNKISPSTVPEIRVRSSTPPPSLLSQCQQRTTHYGSTNTRCNHTECCVTCARKLEMAAEIEAQLELFGAEMERLRSRSQAVLGMLNTLHSADTTN
ncbi:uncharacterized protein LOC124404922 isoform X2 [Diprion similis]|uniref:uncharacterized protein LOC124404922 isoform X2 n=1 Tax=Diprion similis TaxID=362088 RepID=UPI001EF98D34|nr:uncharacterized protein LOC124404922 isoform X2 [Diprion similis]